MRVVFEETPTIYIVSATGGYYVLSKLLVWLFSD